MSREGGLSECTLGERLSTVSAIAVCLHGGLNCFLICENDQNLPINSNAFENCSFSLQLAIPDLFLFAKVCDKYLFD